MRGNVKKRNGKVMALVGAQLGSEGKGVVSYHMRDEFKWAVRTGAPNAGHSFVHEGKLYKMQTLPCPWPNKDCMLVLGAGALINIKVLETEVEVARKAGLGVRGRLFIDANAGILEDRHHREEGGIEGELHRRMGSTGEGVGVARRDRISRDPARFRLAKDCEELEAMGLAVVDTVEMLGGAILDGQNVMLEGTQGSGLSLVHGAWPHVTSSDTNAAQLAADAGIPPQWVTDVVLVARTYPIRVAGKSGPLHNELTWDTMSYRVGRKVEERTTVTKKVRRIGEWDERLFHKAVRLNAPTEVALTFMDYLDPKSRGARSVTQLGGHGLDFVHYVERTWGVPVTLVGTDFSEDAGWSCIDRRKAA